MAGALEDSVSLARPADVGLWVEQLAGDELAVRARRLANIEGGVGEPVSIASTTSTESTSTHHVGNREAVSVPRSDRPSLSKRSIVVGTLALALVASAVALTEQLERGTAAATVTQAAPATASGGAATPPAPAAPAPAAPAPTATPTSSAAERPPPPSAGADHRKRGPKVSRQPPPAPTCDQQFFFDSMGIKRFRPECI
jgi:hypothetical protein